MEIDMPVALPTVPRDALRDNSNSTLAFHLGIAVVLLLLAILSIAAGVAPTVDPVAFPMP
jgi:hypothetical protein